MLLCRAPFPPSAGGACSSARRRWRCWRHRRHRLRIDSAREGRRRPARSNSTGPRSDGRAGRQRRGGGTAQDRRGADRRRRPARRARQGPHRRDHQDLRRDAADVVDHHVDVVQPDRRRRRRRARRPSRPPPPTWSPPSSSPPTARPCWPPSSPATGRAARLDRGGVHGRRHRRAGRRGATLVTSPGATRRRLRRGRPTPRTPPCSTRSPASTAPSTATAWCRRIRRPTPTTWCPSRWPATASCARRPSPGSPPAT